MLWVGRGQGLPQPQPIIPPPGVAGPPGAWPVPSGPGCPSLRLEARAEWPPCLPRFWGPEGSAQRVVRLLLEPGPPPLALSSPWSPPGDRSPKTKTLGSGWGVGGRAAGGCSERALGWGPPPAGPCRRTGGVRAHFPASRLRPWRGQDVREKPEWQELRGSGRGGGRGLRRAAECALQQVHGLLSGSPGAGERPAYQFPG